MPEEEPSGSGGKRISVPWRKRPRHLWVTGLFAGKGEAVMEEGAVPGRGTGTKTRRDTARRAGKGSLMRKCPGRLPGLSGKSDGAGVTCTVLWENQGEGLAGWREKEKVGKCPNAGWEPFRRPGGKTGRSSGRRPGGRKWPVPFAGRGGRPRAREDSRALDS